jgi:hypothetical protein
VARPGPRNITVERPLDDTYECFVYASSKYGYSDTNLCFEVGLLSRNVVLQGDDDSPGTQFGMHSIAAMGASMRAENAEWRNCGQSLVVGRYCMHFHLLSDVADSYVRANSVHNSFQRAVTVHATNGLQVVGNVAYHVMAHPFFIEDGVETNNIFDGNLIVDVLSSAGPIRTDASPACFWAANPSNHWRNNACSGGKNGMWLQVSN